MEEKTFFKIAISCSLLGILLLLFITEKTDLSSSNIASLENRSTDTQVKVKGQITNIKETPGLYIIDIKDNTAQAKIIVFKEDTLTIKRGDIIEVQGTMAEYKGKKEILAKEITLF